MLIVADQQRTDLARRGCRESSTGDHDLLAHRAFRHEPIADATAAICHVRSFRDDAFKSSLARLGEERFPVVDHAPTAKVIRRYEAAGFDVSPFAAPSILHFVSSSQTGPNPKVGLSDYFGENAGHDIRNVIVPARCVVYGIFPCAAVRAPLKPKELCGQPLMVKQLNTLGIDAWQQVPVDVALRELAQLISDAQLRKRLLAP
jgi:hypothetical protein